MVKDASLRDIGNVELVDIIPHGRSGYDRLSIEAAVGDYVACGIMPIVLRKAAKRPITLPSVVAPSVPPESPGTATALSAVPFFGGTLVVDVDGNVYGWGDNSICWIAGLVPQFPDVADNSDDILPISLIEAWQNAKQVFLTDDGSAHIMDGGYARCAIDWIRSGPDIITDYFGQPFGRIVQVITLHGIDPADIRADKGQAMPAVYILRDDGTLWHCFSDRGSDYYEHFDPNRPPLTTPLNSGIDGVVQIAGTYRSVHNYYGVYRLGIYALRRDGTVWFRGFNYFGLAGIGNETADEIAAVDRWTQMPGLVDIVSVTADENGGFAIDSRGDVWGWGINTKYYDNEAEGTRFGFITAKNAYINYDNYGVEYTPVQLPLSNVRQAVGTLYPHPGPGAFYVLEDGSVWVAGIDYCDGIFDYNEMDGNDWDALEENLLNIARHPYLDDVAALAPVCATVIALKNDGSLWGWGSFAATYLGLPDGYTYVSPKTGATRVFDSQSWDNDVVYYPVPIPLEREIRHIANIVTRPANAICDPLPDPDGARYAYAYARLKACAYAYGMSELQEPDTQDAHAYLGCDLLYKVSVDGVNKWAYGFLNWPNDINTVYGVAVNPDGHIWAGAHGGAVHRIAKGGQTVWINYPGQQESVRSVAVGRDYCARVYCGGYSSSSLSSTKAISPDGISLWAVTKDDNYLGGVAVDADNCTYTADWSGYLCKLTASGDTVWEKMLNTRGLQAIAIAPDGYAYVGARCYGYCYKVQPSNGTVIWTGQAPSALEYLGVQAIACDGAGNSYWGVNDYGSGDKLFKLDSAGARMWSSSQYSRGVYGISVDPDGYVYIMARDAHPSKLDANGNTVWQYVSHTGGYSESVAVDPGCSGAFPDAHGLGL